MILGGHHKSYISGLKISHCSVMFLVKCLLQADASRFKCSTTPSYMILECRCEELFYNACVVFLLNFSKYKCLHFENLAQLLFCGLSLKRHIINVLWLALAYCTCNTYTHKVCSHVHNYCGHTYSAPHFSAPLLNSTTNIGY